MLSRTADHLFWMARYMERAENTARMLDVNYQTSLLPQSAEVTMQAWKGLLSISELGADYEKRHGAVSGQAVMDYMVGDPRNPSSIYSCLMAARENARAVRGALTTEVWETQNQTWLEFDRLFNAGNHSRDPSEFYEWVKFRSHLSRGVTLGTMLQDEAFHFLRLGTFLERADNTARLLDVKFHGVQNQGQGQIQGFGQSQGFGPGQSQSQSQTQSQGYGDAERAAPAPAPNDTEFDFYHWSAILRSMSGFEVYRKVYRNVIQPEKVAELLILRADMPRSLAACMDEVVHNLDKVANAQSAETVRRAGRLRADLRYGSIDEILSTGLHAFLTQFLERVGSIGAGISRDFLVPSL
ncbi:MAG: hypothetical protein JWP52_1451 [Rhizobacter sp.]|jgi:uncharacterized alpha-E superfamily protein|nr:hypothetical protein [Rhizobacter sp.]